MADSQYANSIYPAATAYPTAANDCCSSPTSYGARAAATAQQLPSSNTDSGAAAAVVSPGPRRSGCRCWWVALGAIVVLAVVLR